MVCNTVNTGYLFVQKKAKEYKEKGYEVQLDAPLDFLPGFRADLLVRKGDERKVVEVKSRHSLAAKPRLSRLAQLIESKPGWTFELVLIGEPEKLDSPDGARPLESDEIRRRIVDAEKSLEAGTPEAAFLLAWSASEAAIRVLLRDHGVSSKSVTSPGFVLDQGVFNGVISRNDHELLTRLQKYRNAIVHGFGVDEFDGELVTKLIATAKRILNARAVGDDSNGPTTP